MDYSKPPKGCLLIKQHHTLGIFRVFVSYFCWPPEIHTFLFNCWTSQMRFLPPNYTKKTLLEILRSKVPQRAGCAVSEPKVFAWPFCWEEIDPHDHILGGFYQSHRGNNKHGKMKHDENMTTLKLALESIWAKWGKYSCIHLPASMHVVIHVFYYSLYNIHYIQIYIYT